MPPSRRVSSCGKDDSIFASPLWDCTIFRHHDEHDDLKLQCGFFRGLLRLGSRLAVLLARSKVGSGVVEEAVARSVSGQGAKGRGSLAE